MKKLASFILGFVAFIFIMSGGQGSNEVYSKSYIPASPAVVTTSVYWNSSIYGSYVVPGWREQNNATPF